MTNRERVNRILGKCHAYFHRSARARRPFVHIVATYGDMVICSIHP